MKTSAVLILLFFCGCPPSPTPAAPTPDASDASPPTPVLVDATPIVSDDASLATPAGACAHMATIAGCVVLSDCAATITKINAQPGFQHYNVTCLAKATTVAGVEQCGGSCGPAKR